MALNQRAALAAYSSASYYSEQRAPALNAQWLLQQSESSRSAQQLHDERRGRRRRGFERQHVSTLSSGGLPSTDQKLSSLQRSDSIAMPSPALASASAFWWT